MKVESIFNVPPYLAAGFVPGPEVAAAGAAVVAGAVVGFDVVVCGAAVVVVVLEVIAVEEVVDVEQALMNNIETNEIARRINNHFFTRHTSVFIYFEICSTEQSLALNISTHRYLLNLKT